MASLETVSEPEAKGKEDVPSKLSKLKDTLYVMNNDTRPQQPQSLPPRTSLS